MMPQFLSEALANTPENEAVIWSGGIATYRDLTRAQGDVLPSECAP